MLNTYTQIYIQFVFAVQNRMSLIQDAWKNELSKYIINQQQNHKKRTFREEYLELLSRFNVDYDKRYILKDIQ